MKTTSNKDMLNAIRNQASDEYKEKIGVITSDADVRAIPDHLDRFPSIKNEFINTLTNKIVRTDFFSRVYENPLKMLKKGSLPYGNTIEELFVNAAKAKGFFDGTPDFNQGGTSSTAGINADELVKKKEVSLRALYITRNFAHFVETSVSDTQLKAAFMSQNGLSELVNQIVGSLLNGAEQKEFKMMKDTLFAAAAGKQVKTDNKGLVTEGTWDDIPDKLANEQTATWDAAPGVRSVMKYEPVKIEHVNGLGMDIARTIKELAGQMKFVSNEYNMAGVDTWCNPEDLVFITSPKYKSYIDIDALAMAFNVDKSEVPVRIVLVDKLPLTFKRGKIVTGRGTGIGAYSQSSSDQTLNGNTELCYGFLVDKNFIQAIDTVNESRQFDNGRTLTTNLFLHRQGIMSNCYFANCVALVSEAAYTGKLIPN